MVSSVLLLAKRTNRGPLYWSHLCAAILRACFFALLRLALMRLSASQGRYYLVVGCTSGIYVTTRADSCERSHFRLSQSLSRSRGTFQKVLEFIKPTSIVALSKSNNVLVHCEAALFSYLLDLFIRASQRCSDSGAQPLC